MDGIVMEALGNFINSCGFPIAAFVMMWYMCNTTLTKVNDSLQELKLAISEHKEEDNATR